MNIYRKGLNIVEETTTGYIIQAYVDVTYEEFHAVMKEPLSNLNNILKKK